MAQQAPPGTEADDRNEEPVPVLQEFYDNIWLLFLLSMTIVLVSYIVWGIVDLVNIPVAP